MTKNLLVRAWAAAPKILCSAYIPDHRRSGSQTNTESEAWLVVWVTLAGCILGMLLLSLALPDRFFLPETNCELGQHRNGLFDPNDQTLSIHRNPPDEDTDQRPCEARFFIIE